MDRPEIELFEKRMRGEMGLHWKHHMEYVGMHQLLAYVKQLEMKVEGNNE
jgi:hypothetical protein